MPRVTDSDDRSGGTIKVSCNIDCPQCEAVLDTIFDTGQLDEDGLTNVEPEDLTRELVCPECDHVFTASYDGWTVYGEAG